jgi:hypothetical protein
MGTTITPMNSSETPTSSTGGSIAPTKGLRDVGDGGGCPQEHDVRGHLAERRLLLVAGPGRFLSPAEVEEQVQGIEDDQHHCYADAQVLQ